MKRKPAGLKFKYWQLKRIIKSQARQICEDGAMLEHLRDKVETLEKQSTADWYRQQVNQYCSCCSCMPCIKGSPYENKA